MYNWIHVWKLSWPITCALYSRYTPYLYYKAAPKQGLQWVLGTLVYVGVMKVYGWLAISDAAGEKGVMTLPNIFKI